MSTQTVIRVWSDYVCPWCYIGLNEAQKLHQKFDVELDWQPFLLRPDAPEEGWALPEQIKAKMKQPNNPLTARAQALGLQLKEREWIPSSRRAHECTEWARSQGRLGAFHAGVLRRYWSEGQDIHDWAVLEDAAKEAGLEGAAMRRDVEAGQYAAAVDQRIAQAHEYGFHAVPTFLIADKLVVQGAQEYPVFEQAMAHVGVKPSK